MAVHPDGRLVVVEYLAPRLRWLTPDGTSSLLAGDGKLGFADGKGAAARFQYPRGAAFDPHGGLVVADQNNNRLRYVDATGTTTTLAGTGVAGWKDGVAASGMLNSPRGVAIGVDGLIVVGDTGNHRVRRMRRSAQACTIDGRCWQAGVAKPGAPCARCSATASKKAWTVAGDGTPCDDDKPCTAAGGCSKGSCAVVGKSCDDSDACTTDACEAISGACVHDKIIGCNGYCIADSDCDDGNPCTLGASCVANACKQGDAVEVVTLCGATAGYVDGDGKSARLKNPRGVAQLSKAGPGGALVAVGFVVADTGNHRLRLVLADGTTTTLAGSGKPGIVDGVGVKAWLHTPSGADDAPDGGVVFADRGNHTVRKVDVAGKVVTLAGSGVAGYQDDAAPDARFNQPADVAVASSGTIYVADAGNHRIRRLTTSGLVTTHAGVGAGFKDGDVAQARFAYPSGLDVGRDSVVFVADTGNHRIRRVDGEGNVTTIAGAGNQGWLDGDAAKALFSSPWDVAVDGAGRIWVSDRNNHRIRRLQAGLVTTVSGNAAGFLDGGANARFIYPSGLWVHRGGELFVADDGNHRLRRLRDGSASCSVDGACWAQGAANPADACSRCDVGKSVKAFSAIADGGACVDGNPCTLDTVCGAGSCGGGSLFVCDDSNKCSVDACIKATGSCSFTPIQGCK